jgi:hypothetical protein
MQLSTALPEGLQHYGIMYSTTRVIGTAQGQIHGHSDVGKTTERDPGSKHEAIPSEPQLGRPLATSFRHLLARNQLASNLQRGILPRASFSDTRFHLAPSTDLCPTASFSSSLSSEPQLGRPTSILLQPTRPSEPQLGRPTCYFVSAYCSCFPCSSISSPIIQQARGDNKASCKSRLDSPEDCTFDQRVRHN